MTTTVKIRFYLIFTCMAILGMISLHFYATAVPELSKQHRDNIRVILTQIPHSMAIFIIKVDLPSNSQYVFHRTETDSELKLLDDEYFNHLLTGAILPLFSKETDANQRIIRLINHEFDCSPYSETLPSKTIPKTNKIVNTVCSIAIPPSYGYFVGYVTVYLSQVPTIEEQNNIRLLIKEFSDSIQKDLGK